jgi:hypothetical protein
MWQQWVNLVLGLWIIVSAYTGMTAAGMATNLTISGLAIAILAVWGALQHQSHAHGHQQESHYRTT